MKMGQLDDAARERPIEYVKLSPCVLEKQAAKSKNNQSLRCDLSGGRRRDAVATSWKHRPASTNRPFTAVRMPFLSKSGARLSGAMAVTRMLLHVGEGPEMGVARRRRQSRAPLRDARHSSATSRGHDGRRCGVRAAACGVRAGLRAARQREEKRPATREASMPRRDIHRRPAHTCQRKNSLIFLAARMLGAHGEGPFGERKYDDWCRCRRNRRRRRISREASVARQNARAPICGLYGRDDAPCHRVIGGAYIKNEGGLRRLGGADRLARSIGMSASRKSWLE